MCLRSGSIDQAVTVCPMCRVFSYSRCPHVRGVCQNRAIHPRFDVSFLKNAEVDSFNGCGYCKWARTNPPQKSAGLGWPGCCRAPSTNTECRMINAADWKPISIVHHVPIPDDVRAILDSLGRGTMGSASAGRLPAKVSAQTPDRKPKAPSKPSVAIPAKQRADGSPKATSSSLGRSVSTSVPSSSPLEQRPDKLPHSAHSSPNRRQVDLPTTPRRSSTSKITNTRNASPASSSKVATDARSQSSQSPERRRVAPPASSINPSSTKSSPPSSRTSEPLGMSSVVPRSSKQNDNMSSASSSSGSSGSMTDSTVTSDGGFTDYLSDESEAELQRQAEAKAALLAQNQAEELEFKSARQQLVHVDLRPPRSWNPTNITNNVSVRAPTGTGRA